MTLTKYARVAANVRAQIEDGKLTPGQSAPSGAELARITGYSVLTCRRALRSLIAEGVLVAGASRNARPRVPRPASAHEQTCSDAARALSAALANRRRAAGLIQPQLAAITEVSVTTVGHAETGRLWQSRGFWERADAGLSAGGELLSLHDAFRAAQVSPDSPDMMNVAVAATTANPVSVAHVTITWANGEVTTIYPPHHIAG